MEGCVKDIGRCEVKLYGSCAVGLALWNSDVDVAVEPGFLRFVVGRFLEPREAVKKGL